MLVLVGVRLFERAGRRHRKQLETIVDAARRIGDGDRDVALVAGQGARSGASPARSSTSRTACATSIVSEGSTSHRSVTTCAIPSRSSAPTRPCLRQGERSRPRAAQLQTIEDEVSRLAVMVDDLLALGRTHALALHIQRAPVDVRAIVSDAAAAARARSGRKRVLLLAPPGAMRAVVDAQRLRQALDNLLDNAIRHARSEVRVELALATPAQGVVLSVEDDGPGIDRELLPRLFEAFAHGAERAGGAGLGLSTVRAIAEAHGGGVSVGDGRERGTRVTLRLPLTPAEAVAS